MKLLELVQLQFDREGKYFEPMSLLDLEVGEPYIINLILEIGNKCNGSVRDSKCF